MMFAVLLLAHARITEAASDITLTVTASGASQRAYIGLVREDRAWHDPSAEIVAEDGTATLSAENGAYRVLVAAVGYTPQIVSLPVESDIHKKLRVDLSPDVSIRGTVSDERGGPVAGARVSRVGIDASEMGREYLAASVTTSNAQGAWSLPRSLMAKTALLVEADGYSPAIAVPGENDRVDVVLRQGAALHLDLDRADPDLFITLQASTFSAVPSEFQRVVWTRAATAASIDWTSLPEGKFDVLVRHRDPRRFLYDRSVGQVVLNKGARTVSRVTLPSVTPIVGAFSSLLIGSTQYIDRARAYERRPTGEAALVPHAAESVAGGVLLYVATVNPGGLWIETPTHLFTVKRTTDVAISNRAAMPAVAHDRADARVRIRPADPTLRVPAMGVAESYGCPRALTLHVPFDVAADGTAIFAAPAGCRRVILRWSLFEAVVFEKGLRRLEMNDLGEHVLSIAGHLEVRVTRDTEGEPLAGALVRVLLAQQIETVIAEATTNEEGRVVFGGLPVNRGLLVEARDRKRALTGIANIDLLPGERKVLDPLLVPPPASLMVKPQLALKFRELYPEAKIVAVHLSSAAIDAPKDALTRGIRAGGEASFEVLRPGTWRIRAVVEGGGTAQPLHVEDVQLESGENRVIEPVLEPLVFRGRVHHMERGIEASVSVADLPGPGAVRRRVRSRPDGMFTIILGERGLYDVEVLLEHDADPISVGQAAFEDPSQLVDIPVLSGGVLARVRDPRGHAVAGATLTAGLRATGRRGFDVIERKKASNGAGEAGFDGLRPGVWLIRAHHEQSGSSAEQVVSVGSDSAQSIDLELTTDDEIHGVIRDAAGTAVAGASLSCLVVGINSFPQITSTRTDAAGTFRIHISKAASAVPCGVATRDGRVATYRVKSGSRAEFVLPPAVGSLFIPDWMSFPRETLWLVSSNGVINLNAIASAQGQPWSELRIEHLAVGDWKVVEVRSVEGLVALARGGASGLRTISEVRIEPGEVSEIVLGNIRKPSV